jgi:uncharacterized membrane protein YfcA
MDSSYIIAGVLVGILVGLTGVGGGSLMTPLLVFLFGFNPTVAVGTDLLFAAITKSVGVLTHHRSHGSVNWKIAERLSIGSIPAALLTLYFLRSYAQLGRDISRPITLTLGIALILTAFALCIKHQVRSFSQRLPRSAIRFIGEHRRTATIVIGAVLGVLVTLSSVGAGALGTVSLLILYPTLPAVRVVGTDLAYAIPLTAVAGTGHWALGNVNWHLLATLLVGSVPGIWFGSRLSAKIPERVLRPILVAMLLIVALKCLWR